MEEEYRYTISDATYFLQRNPCLMRSYLGEFYTPEGQKQMGVFFMKNPLQASIILRDYDKTNNEKIEEFFHLLHSAEGMLVYIVGAKGSGKTCTSFFIAEREHLENPNRNIFYIGRQFNKGALPEWCGWREKVQDVPNGSFGIIDELGIQASARNFAKKDNKDLSMVLVLARQKKIPLIILTQDTRLGDVNVWRLRDILLWKVSNTYGFGIRGDNRKERGFWDKVKYLMKAREKEQCLVEYEAKRRFIHFEHELPDCWNDDLSEIYADLSFQTKTDEALNDLIRKEARGLNKLKVEHGC